MIESSLSAVATVPAAFNAPAAPLVAVYAAEVALYAKASPFLVFGRYRSTVSKADVVNSMNESDLRIGWGMSVPPESGRRQ